ncbi:unnamed protein product [Bursaphelenchus xylophilus]|uniref:(pine wood nematode) hypothetical protein n=1 Tax=Bursaphelenchus xylophilus TaxID=6326 RepID=A0A1I7SU98_BURXY|nr:unnamed protein product [Bursaphelenchus xylophilus]CAG9107397.1 unnamed protein product [Bursaphelenchus xylophilus]
MGFLSRPLLLAILLSLLHITISEESVKKQCSFYCFTFPQKDETIASLNKSISSVLNIGCSHLVYGHALVDSMGRIKNPTDNDIVLDSYYGNYKNLKTLQMKNPKVKVLVGLREDVGVNFLDQSVVRETVIRNIITLIDDNKFDGVFLDLKSPRFASFHFRRFLMELRKETMGMEGEENPVLVALSVDAAEVYGAAENLKEIEKLVDVFYIKADNVIGSQADTETLLMTPLDHANVIPKEVTLNDVSDALDDIMLERQKIVVGLSGWARGYVLDDPKKPGPLVDALGFARRPNSTRKDGRFSYQEICDLAVPDDYHFENIMGSVWFQGSDANWYSFLPPGHETVDRILTWVANKHYGGIGLMQLEADDPKGDCGEPYPLHRDIQKKLKCAPREQVRGNTAPCNRFCTLRTASSDVTLDFDLFDPEWCSHYIISSIDFTSTGLLKIDDKFNVVIGKYNDWAPKIKPNLLVSIGDTVDSKTWKFVMKSEVLRKLLVSNVKQFYERRNLDGLVISWLSGSMGNKDNSDSQSFHLFLKELKDALPKALLVVTATAEGTFDQGYDIKVLNQTANYLLVEMFRFHDSSMGSTGHPSPLLGNSELIEDGSRTVEAMANEWISRGFPRKRLIPQFSPQVLYFGLAKGVEYRADSPVGQKVDQSRAVKNRSNKEFITQTELCHILNSTEAKSHFIPEMAVPTAVKGNEFFAYDDKRSIKVKTIWTSLSQFGGIALTGLEMDNVQGQCPAGQPYPILKTIVDSQTCDLCVKEREIPNNIQPECAGDPFRVVCSYRLPDVNDKKNPLRPDKIPFGQCSEIVVEETLMEKNGDLKFRDSTALENMKILKKHDRQGKRLIAAIRCPSANPDEFKNLMKNGRDKLIKNIFAHMNEFGFEGIELRCDDMLTPEVKANFGNTLRTLLNKIRNEEGTQCRKTLSIRIPVWQQELGSVYDTGVFRYLHQVVLEPFQIESNQTQLISPLFAVDTKSFTQNSIDSTLKAWVKAGVPQSKILLHIPAYGIKQDLAKASETPELGAQVRGGIRVLSQGEVCQTVKKPGVVTQMMYDMVAAFSTTPANEFISYETQQTIHYKIKYAVREQLAGVGLLTINEDDHMDVCRQGKFPLLKEIHSAIC